MHLPFLLPLLFTSSLASPIGFQLPLFSSRPSTSASVHNRTVPVTLGVMSKCPDALTCENVFDTVLGRLDLTKIKLQTVYLGSEDNDGHLVCKHGESECAGNIQQLCFRSIYPEIEDWWSFLQCQNYGKISDIGDWDLAKRCATVAKKEWKGAFEECVNGQDGRGLLRDSFSLAKHLGIEKSCTIQISGSTTCVHDDGSWKGCDQGHEAADFVAEINKEYDRLNGDSSL